MRCTRPGCRVVSKVFGDEIKEARQWPDSIGFISRGQGRYRELNERVSRGGKGGLRVMRKDGLLGMGHRLEPRAQDEALALLLRS